MTDEDLQFWRIDRVAEAIGFSKSEIYRQVSLGAFPAPRPYPNNPRKSFWVAGEVRRWQQVAIDCQPEVLQ